MNRMIRARAAQYRRRPRVRRDSPFRWRCYSNRRESVPFFEDAGAFPERRPVRRSPRRIEKMRCIKNPGRRFARDLDGRPQKSAIAACIVAALRKTPEQAARIERKPLIQKVIF
ncbi:hypothetical protein GR157_28935 [Burkholderia sp. 4701]|nr:hypothetical protein [Burkholderia sp. 4701]MXN85749.1 hypothetical protein [Burkholderia sp. 4812]